MLVSLLLLLIYSLNLDLINGFSLSFSSALLFVLRSRIKLLFGSFGIWLQTFLVSYFRCQASSVSLIRPNAAAHCQMCLTARAYR